MTQGFTQNITIPVPISKGGTGTTGSGFLDANGNFVWTVGSTSSAVNYLTFINNSAGNIPVINVNGADTNIGIGFQSKGTGQYEFFGTSTTAGGLRIYENDTNGSDYVGLKSPASIATSYTLTLPSADATVANLPLVSDASANLSFSNTISFLQVNDANGNEAFRINTAASAVNYVSIANAATGNNPGFNALGDDTNVGLNFNSKGTGGYTFTGTSTAPAVINMFEQTTNGTNKISINAPASISSDQTVTWKSASSGYPILDSTDSDAWTAFTPGVTGFSSTTSLVGHYKKIGKTCVIRLSISGTSNANTFTVTGLPFTNGIATSTFLGFQFAQNNTANTIASIGIPGASTVLTVYNTTASTATGWTASGTKALYCTFVYETT